MSNPGQESPDNDALRDLRDVTKQSNRSTIINSVIVFILTLVLIWLGFSQLKVSDNDVPVKTTFEKNQECSGYSDLVNTKIEESGRVFENDTYTVKGIFYSPQLDTCLYAWVLHTTSEPKEIYSIDDIFGVGIFTAGISENASELFFDEIKKLKE